MINGEEQIDYSYRKMESFPFDLVLVSAIVLLQLYVLGSWISVIIS